MLSDLDETRLALELMRDEVREVLGNEQPAIGRDALRDGLTE